MHPEETIKHLDKHFGKLKDHFQNVVQHFDVDAIHDFRVEVKKLRAMFRLMSASISHHQLKIPGTIKTFYASIGIIRNLQLQRLRMQTTVEMIDASPPSRYLGYLQIEEEDQKKRARELAIQVSIEILQEKVLKSLPRLIDKENPKVFVEQKHTRLQQLVMAPLLADEDLHDIRKTVKDLLYTWKYIEPDAVAVLPVPLASTERLDQLSGSLGDFCDVCVALSLLEAIHTTPVTDETERETLMEVSQKWEVEKLVMKTQLREGLVLLRSPEKDMDTAPGT